MNEGRRDSETVACRLTMAETAEDRMTFYFVSGPRQESRLV